MFRRIAKNASIEFHIAQSKRTLDYVKRECDKLSEFETNGTPKPLVNMLNARKPGLLKLACHWHLVPPTQNNVNVIERATELGAALPDFVDKLDSYKTHDEFEKFSMDYLRSMGSILTKLASSSAEGSMVSYLSKLEKNRAALNEYTWLSTQENVGLFIKVWASKCKDLIDLFFYGYTNLNPFGTYSAVRLAIENYAEAHALDAGLLSSFNTSDFSDKKFFVKAQEVERLLHQCLFATRDDETRVSLEEFARDSGVDGADYKKGNIFQKLEKIAERTLWENIVSDYGLASDMLHPNGNQNSVYMHSNEKIFHAKSIKEVNSVSTRPFMLAIFGIAEIITTISNPFPEPPANEKLSRKDFMALIGDKISLD